MFLSIRRAIPGAVIIDICQLWGCAALAMPTVAEIKYFTGMVLMCGLGYLGGTLLRQERRE
jgi:hypothetical protein